MSKYVVKQWRRNTSCALLALLCACVTNPVTGRSEISLMSPAQEAAIGREEASKVEQQIGLVRDAKLTEYVSRVGERVAAFSPRKDVRYRFYVADMEEPNAFALPGGYIYVSRGLLALTNSEAELAGVIGHEIGHVAARHAAQRQTRATGVGVLTMLGVLAGAALGGAEMGQAAAQLGQVAGAGFIASYSRDQERQSDDVGQRMAAAAGYEPGGISEFLRTLGRDTTLRLGTKRRPTFLDSHPVTDERVRTTSERARTLQQAPSVSPFLPTRDAFVSSFDGLRIGPDPAEGVFVESAFLHGGLQFGMTFPRGWQTTNQRSFVGAQSTEQDALITLEAVGSRGDPAAYAQAFLDNARFSPQIAERVRLGSLDAYRLLAEVQSQQGPVVGEWVFVEHPNGIYQISSLSSSSTYDRRRRELQSAIRSFHVLGADELSSIRDRRLRVVSARSGESLAALCSRAGSAWTPDEVAVANGLLASDRIQGGMPIKIAVDVPYQR